MPTNHVGTLNENPLHAALKRWYARDTDSLEVTVDGYVVDVVQDDYLVEIQTGTFSALKAKLADLVERHTVRLVYPVAREKWIVKLDREDGTPMKPRKSPKHGNLFDVFVPLVSIPHLLDHPNFELEVLLVQMEEVRRYDGQRAWRRRGWVIEERRLLDVVAQHRFHNASGLADLLPQELPDRFTTAHLATAINRSRNVAQKVAYCLRECEAISCVGKKGNALVYSR